jgi:uroporphyrinogen-III synthase
MKTTVLITRPETEAQDFRDTLTAHGLTPVCDPLLIVTPLQQNFDAQPDALVTTSPQAFRISYPDAWQNLPLFVMGETSRQRAASSGFKNIMSSGGEFDTLMSLISKKVPSGQKILYLRGETIRHDLKDRLSDYDVFEHIVYQTQPASSLSEQTLTLLKAGELNVVTLFSPRSAEIFYDLLSRAGLTEACKDIKLLCLSSAVLESVKALPWQAVRVSVTPDQQGMTDALQDWIGPARDA